MDQANLVVPVPKPKDWKQHFLKPMMTGLQEVEPLESLDPVNELTGLLQDWTTNRQSARTMDDIFNKLPYTDEKREYTYFRMEDFYNFCKRNHWEKDKNQTGNLIKQLDEFIGEERVRIKKQQPRLIKIKTMKQTEASVSKVTISRRKLLMFDRDVGKNWHLRLRLKIEELQERVDYLNMKNRLLRNKIKKYEDNNTRTTRNGKDNNTIESSRRVHTRRR